MNRTIALVLSLSLCGVVQAANKCVMPSGKVEYTDAICPTEASKTTVRTDQNTLPGTEAAPPGEQHGKTVRQTGRIENGETRCPSNSPDNFATAGQEQAMREHSKCLEAMGKKSTAPLYFK